MGPGAPLQARPIDMGLPSGIQWASCNVGAERPSDLGLYFSWGNIEGHGIDEGYNFSQTVYDSTPAASIDTDLSLSQDAARAILGTPWRMPTDDDFQELFNNCTYLWTTLNGVNGCLLTSNVNGNSVFFPAAGYYNGSSLNSRGSYGFCWSSTYQAEAVARCVSFNSSTDIRRDSRNRYLGFSVRAVYPPL